MPPPASNPDLWPFDLESGVRVASMAGNLPSKFGHARPLGWVLECSLGFAMYSTDGQTDRQTDRQKQRLLPLPYDRGHNKTGHEIQYVQSLSGSIMFSICPSVYPSVRSFVRLFVCLLTNLWTYFEKESTDFDANWYNWSTRQGHEKSQLSGHEVKDWGHMSPTIDMEA